MPDPHSLQGRIGNRPAMNVFFAGVWLVFLGGTAADAWALRDLPQGRVALVALIVFVCCYLLLAGRVRSLAPPPGQPTPPIAVALLVVLCGLTAVLIWALGQEGVASVVYLAAAAMQVLPIRPGLIAVFVLAAANALAGRLVPGWNEDVSISLAIAAVGVALWGVRQMIARNRDLALAREENARLAVDQERNRFARDLHDILGHSLTVIAVKAELAGRLFDADPARARTEVAEVERLSRDALADVRQAVSGYRQPSLSGELVRARQALAAAGIEADLPNSTDEVAGDLRDLFAWTVREGVTNVVRHSGARHCRVRLSASEVVVSDDGRGPGDSVPGHGLVGLRERAAASGATVVTEALDPGFALRVAVRP